MGLRPRTSISTLDITLRLLHPSNVRQSIGIVHICSSASLHLSIASCLRTGRPQKKKKKKDKIPLQACTDRARSSPPSNALSLSSQPFSPSAPPVSSFHPIITPLFAAALVRRVAARVFGNAHKRKQNTPLGWGGFFLHMNVGVGVGGMVGVYFYALRVPNLPHNSTLLYRYICSLCMRRARVPRKAWGKSGATQQEQYPAWRTRCYA